MGVPLKTENEECAGKTRQVRGSEGGRRSLPALGGARGDQGLPGTCRLGTRWRVARQPSARLTHGLKLDTAMWLLRCSVFKGIPMAFSCYYFKELNCYKKSKNDKGERRKKIQDRRQKKSRVDAKGFQRSAAGGQVIRTYSRERAGRGKKGKEDKKNIH